MRHGTKLLAVLLLAGSSAVLADSPVWKVSNGKNEIFLGGTVHLLSDEDFPLPLGFERAYAGTQLLVVEADMQKLQSPEGMQKMMRRLSYSDGRSIQQVVSADTYHSLEKFFTERGVEMSQLEAMKPGMLSMMISVIELQRLGMAGEGVDAYFEKKALDQQRPRMQLETVDTQIEFLANMGVGREDDLINYSLEEALRISSLMRSMKDAWRKGDMDELTRIAIDPLIDRFPKIYKAMLVDRNNDWMPKLLAMFKTPEIELVLVGALHLAGRDGLLAMLRARGYRIEQLP